MTRDPQHDIAHAVTTTKDGRRWRQGSDALWRTPGPDGQDATPVTGTELLAIDSAARGEARP